MESLRCFSYNLRYDNPRDGANAFSLRRAYVQRVFPGYGADLVGFQEVLPAMRDWLEEAFPAYTFVGIGRDADFLGESNPIAFAKERFQLLEASQFWLSDTPQVPGSRFESDQSVCPRICVSVTLRCKKTGKLLRMYNTHLDHVGELARAQGMTLVLTRMAEDASRLKTPVILTGDFNLMPPSPVLDSIQRFAGLGEPLREATADIPFTYHGYHPEEIREKIDYLYSTLPFDAPVAARDVENGVYLSDHYPVGAKLYL